MKYFKFVVFLIGTLLSFTASADDRQLLFLQQKTPGHIIYVSLVEVGNKAVLNVVGLGASTIKKKGNLPAKEFDNLWELANSVSVKKFIIPDDKEANMADPNFYTVTVKDPRSTTNIQLPVSGEAGTVNELINKFAQFIPAQS